MIAYEDKEERQAIQRTKKQRLKEMSMLTTDKAEVMT